MRFLWVKMSVCLLGSITANSSFPHCNLNCFVSSNARWHSSFQDYASSLWFQKLVIHEIGRQTWEGGNGFGILSSQARVMVVENNNGQSVAARGDEGAKQPWQLDVSILKVQNTSSQIKHWVRVQSHYTAFGINTWNGFWDMAIFPVWQLDCPKI